MTTACAGELVLLIGKDFRRFIFRLTEEGRMQTHHGVIKHAEMIGQPYGSEVRSHLGYPFYMLRPTTADLVQDLKRSGQILFPKDLGYILMKLGIRPGSRGKDQLPDARILLEGYAGLVCRLKAPYRVLPNPGRD